MWVFPENKSPEEVQWLIRAVLPESRFRCDMEVQTYARKRRLGLKISCVRLLRKKFYCGQHPNGCVVNPFNGPRKRPRASYLEGLDWVGFNDMLNDVCDQHRVVADIWSQSLEFRGTMKIRKGEWRLAQYESDSIFNGIVTFFHWDVSNQSTLELYVNRMGNAEGFHAKYPDGTPGLPEWRAEVAKAEEDVLVAATNPYDDDDH